MKSEKKEWPYENVAVSKELINKIKELKSKMGISIKFFVETAINNELKAVERKK